MSKGLELYKHNEESLKKVIGAFQNNEQVVGIVHATGTGKSYNALELARQNSDKRIVYVVPSVGIIEHLKNIIKESNLSLESDFSNLEFRTYQSFINLSLEEIENIPCDLLIIDEFHHLGAPVWGARINTMIETHPDMKIFGMTAYTVRDRGTVYERDMADNGELFDGRIVSRYDLCDAIIDGVLPKPIYKSSHINLLELAEEVEESLSNLDQNSKEYQEYLKIVKDVKRRIHEAPSIPTLIKKNINPSGKYIYFCPPLSQDKVNDIETIKAEAKEWFKEIANEEDIIFYTSTSEMGEEGKRNRDAFYSDTNLNGEKVDNKLRVMFAINQYNEGIHAPNVDGVIMGRSTSSDIVYFEQLGRALAVRGNTKEKYEYYNNLSVEELKYLFEEKDILLVGEFTKEELIEKLISPVVIDLTDNYTFIKELENNLGNRIKDIRINNEAGYQREIKITDSKFNIELVNQDLFMTLSNLRERLTTWNYMYEYAKIYAREHGDLEVHARFKTNDGYTYDVNGKINLGQWIAKQRRKLESTSERYQRLLEIGMRFENKTLSWDEMYEYAKIYASKHGNLEVITKFRTNDGYTYDESGKIKLGVWIARQRSILDPTSNHYKMLLELGMRFENKISNLTWDEMYEYAKAYVQKHGDLEVPYSFITSDGLTYNPLGNVKLGMWISRQRKMLKPISMRYQKLKELGMRFENKISTLSWSEVYEYAKIYARENGNLEVPQSFKTNDGYTYDESGKINLGKWIARQRLVLEPTSERYQMLLELGMRFENKMLSWDEMYEYAKIYAEKHKTLEVPQNFKTNDGYTYDEFGKINLGGWIARQRFGSEPVSEEYQKLLQLGMRFEKIIKRFSWDEMYEYAKIYAEKHGNLKMTYNFKTNDGYTYDEFGKINLGKWITLQRYRLNPESDRYQKLFGLGMRFENIRNNKEKNYRICNTYMIDYKTNVDVLKNISYQVLLAKINYLINNNLSLVDSKGKLIDIFKMSNLDMQEKYGVTIEDLLNMEIERSDEDVSR